MQGQLWHNDPSAGPGKQRRAVTSCPGLPKQPQKQTIMTEKPSQTNDQTDNSLNTTLSRRNLLEYWWVIPVTGAAGFFGWFGLRAFSIRFTKPMPGQPQFIASQSHFVGDLGALAKVWDTIEFEYPHQLGSRMVATPSILIRVPTAQLGGLSLAVAGEERHFLGLSRICTHQECSCTWVRDPVTMNMAYNYRPPQNQPMLGCSCHQSAFDPLQAGRSVSGPALQPLPRLWLQNQGEQLLVVGYEPRQM
jgi:arsenite oxidase small subunit